VADIASKAIFSNYAGLLPCGMFNFGKPKTTGDWLVHFAGAVVAIFLVWWMLRMNVL